eukprot:6970403-Prymnesium_polylepis.1
MMIHSSILESLVGYGPADVSSLIPDNEATLPFLRQLYAIYVVKLAEYYQRECEAHYDRASAATQFLCNNTVVAMHDTFHSTRANSRKLIDVASRVFLQSTVARQVYPLSLIHI